MSKYSTLDEPIIAHSETFNTAMDSHGGSLHDFCGVTSTPPLLWLASQDGPGVTGAIYDFTARDLSGGSHWCLTPKPYHIYHTHSHKNVTFYSWTSSLGGLSTFQETLYMNQKPLDSWISHDYLPTMQSWHVELTNILCARLWYWKHSGPMRAANASG